MTTRSDGSGTAAQLLAATFTEHESQAPDVTATRLAIEAELQRRPARRHVIAPRGVLAAAAGVVAAAAVGVVAVSVRDGSAQHGAAAPGGQVSHPAASTALPTSTVPSGPSGPSGPVTMGPPARSALFRFQPAWLPPHATLDHREAGTGPYRLEDYTFGDAPGQVRGLTLWWNTGPLPDSLRDGGTLTPITVAGARAVGGWSALGRKYTVAVQRPGGMVMTVAAYGWTRSVARDYATHVARELRYGRFLEPVSTP